MPDLDLADPRRPRRRRRATAPYTVGVAGGRVVAGRARRTEHPSPARGTAWLDDEVLLPGLVDTHVHLQDPGNTEWEDFDRPPARRPRAASRRCVDMPLDSVPVTVSLDALAVKQRRAEGRVRVDVGFWAGVTPTNLAELAGLHDGGRHGLQVLPGQHRAAGVPARRRAADAARRWPSWPGWTRCSSCTPRTPARSSARRRRRPGATWTSWPAGPRRSRTSPSRRSSTVPGTPVPGPTCCTCPARTASSCSRRRSARAAGQCRDLPALPRPHRGGGAGRRDRVQDRAADPRGRERRPALAMAWPTAPSAWSCPTTPPVRRT